MEPGIKIPNSSEIDQALKEFEAKSGSGVGQVPSAPVPEVAGDAGINFEEDKWQQSTSSPQNDMPGMVRLVIKLSGGTIKEQRQAEYVLLGIAVAVFAFSMYLFFGGGSNRPSPANNNIIPGQMQGLGTESGQ